jgi:hypothetical protein
MYVSMDSVMYFFPQSSYITIPITLLEGDEDKKKIRKNERASRPLIGFTN